MKVAEKLAPELRFPGFEGDWGKSQLGSVTKYVKGFAFKSNDYDEIGVRIVRVSDLGADRIKNDNDKIFIAPEKAKEHKKYRLDKHDIIITTVGSKPEMVDSAVGRGVFITKDDEGLLNQNMLKFGKKQTVSNGFLIGYINSKRYQYYIKAIARGNANQANITVVDLLKFKLSIPSLPEQQKIASFLSAVDKKIEKLTRKKRLLEKYKKGVMQKIFSQEIRFKDDSGKEFPDWEEKRLGYVAERITNKNIDDSVNYVLTNSAKKGIVSQLDFFDKNIADKNNLKNYYIVSKNDFVYNPRISKFAPVGPIKRNKLNKGVMSPLYSIFRFNTTTLAYYEFFFETSSWHKYMHSIANFGARHDRMNITNSDFFKMPIPHPIFEEREKISNFLSNIDKKIESVQTQLKQTQTFKKGLLQKMFV